ncbi:dihydroneopterin aldolase [Virgibacillus xinjiangensis]|uniref:7,8-dihydroneopterin aldolase n=1 Tax=Virgibacillus xinjiangensis TaxID=393090 RepID=A0ABV7CXD6_9BACI
MDKIILNGAKFYGYHGLFPEENRLGQRFEVNAVLYLDLKQAAKTDDMNASINYGDVYQRIGSIVEGEAVNLVETLADKIADELLGQYGRLEACLVKVVKPDPPIPGHYESVAVEIYREREK